MNVQKRLPPKIPYKDPDIWDPPESLQKNVSNPKISKPVSRANKNFNVSKPNPKGSIKKIKKQEGRPSFLLERYPEGDGPDKNLIEMLERDVIDFSPNVNFDDIA